MTNIEMAVKQKSFSLTRLFHKSTTKLGSHGKSSNGTIVPPCEIHKNVKASNDQTITGMTGIDDLVLDQKRTMEQNNNHESTDNNKEINSHKKVTKTKSDTDITTKTNVHNNHHECSPSGHGSGHRISLKRLKFNHKKNSCSSCTALRSTSSSQSSSFKEDSHSKRQSCLSISDFEAEEDCGDERDQASVHPYAVLFESIQYKDTNLLDNVFKSYPNLDINCLNEDGIAAIHFAAMVGSTACIDTMVKYGADIDLQDIRGNPPVHYAMSMKKYEFAGMLIKLGAKTNHLSSQLYPELKKKSRKTWHLF